MSFGKDSPIMFVMDGNKLVDVIRTDDTASKQNPDQVELEVMRIVKEHKKQAERVEELEKSNEEWIEWVAGFIRELVHIGILTKKQVLQLLKDKE